MYLSIIYVYVSVCVCVCPLAAIGTVCAWTYLRGGSERPLLHNSSDFFKYFVTKELTRKNMKCPYHSKYERVSSIRSICQH